MKSVKTHNGYYQDVLERCKKQGIDVSDKSILIVGMGISLDGETLFGIPAFSKDGLWVCIPVRDIVAEEEAYNYGHQDPIGPRYYVPKCYEIYSEYEAFLGTGIAVRCKIYLLNN